MAKQMLAPLKRQERTEEITPYLERIAQQGMRVTFLLRYPVHGYLWPNLDPGVQASSEVKLMAKYYTWDEQTRLAENKVFPAREALEKKGVEVTVDICTQRLRKAVESYRRNGDVHLIVMRAGIGLGLKKLLHGMVRFFKQPSPPPAYVVHPGTPL